MQKKYLDQFYKNIHEGALGKKGAIYTVPMVLISEYILSDTKYIFEGHGLTRSEIDVLVTLHFMGGNVTPTELSEGLIFTTSGISKVIKKLEFKGLVSKQISPTDKRSVQIQLEEEGLKIVSDCIPRIEEHESKFYEVLNETEKEIFEKVLKKLLYSFIKE